MVVFRQGLEEVRDFLFGDISHGQAGTGNGLPSETGTGLESEVESTKKSLTKQKTNNPAGINFEHVISVTEGNGSELSEWEVRMSDDSKAFNRTVTTNFSKTSTKEFVRLVTVEITQD